MEQQQNHNGLNIQLNSQIKYIQNQIKIKTKQIQMLKQTVFQLEIQKTQIKQKFDQVNYEKEQLSSRFKAQFKLILEAQKQVSTQLQRMMNQNKKLNKIIEEKDYAIKIANKKVREIEQNINSDDTKFKNQANQIILIKTKVVELEKINKKLKSQVKQYSKNHQSIQKEIQVLKQQIEMKRKEDLKVKKINENLMRKYEQEQMKSNKLNKDLQMKSIQLQKFEKERIMYINRLQQIQFDYEQQKSKFLNQISKQNKKVKLLYQQNQKIKEYYQRKIEQFQEYKSHLQIQPINIHAQNQLKIKILKYQEILNILYNCFTYKLPYINTIEIHQFQQITILINIFHEIKNLFISLQAVIEQKNQFQQQLQNKEKQIKQLNKQMVQLKNQNKQQQFKKIQSFNQLKNQLSLFYVQTDQKLNELQQQLQKKEAIINNMRVQKQSKGNKKNISNQELYYINDQNICLKNKLSKNLDLIEKLCFGLTFQSMRMLKIQEKIKFYKIYQRHYWKLNFINSYSLHEKRRNNIKSKMKKILYVVYFISILTKTKPTQQNMSNIFESVRSKSIKLQLSKIKSRDYIYNNQIIRYNNSFDYDQSNITAQIINYQIQNYFSQNQSEDGILQALVKMVNKNQNQIIIKLKKQKIKQNKLQLLNQSELPQHSQQIAFYSPTYENFRNCKQQDYLYPTKNDFKEGFSSNRKTGIIKSLRKSIYNFL